ncbi:PTS sugar transporter subunit IIB [Sporomusa sp. KB1]|jgi:PTS system cellobiose-specific IIB component|uniref:PTS sugar transporter subunit IIB n=1 Tax=Sporomusa sp. KB1 TaxID=943346 RepID=UPI0011AA7F99|nr:PTS sugar transporter subunit IIB [Sporomusa sp. KB1]TWH45774.1 PTS system cellobiose-specific IIB component [Sporomusa sp. KB1]
MKLLLVCSGGMSSSIVVKAIEKEAAKTGQVVTVKSVGSGEFGEELKNGWDIALVAPQVRHRAAFFQEAAAEYNVPVAIIPPQGYNPMGGAIILAEVKKILG